MPNILVSICVRFKNNRGDLLANELFHAYQHQLIHGENYENYSVAKPGNINIEFEQIVFQDIVNRLSGNSSNVGSMFNQAHLQGIQNAKDSYETWIEGLTNAGTEYPALGSLSGFNTDFLTHLNSFKIYGHPEYTGTDVLPGLLPDALKQLFNSTLDCN